MALILRYRPGQTWLHKSPAVFKILAYLLVNILVSFFTLEILLINTSLIVLFTVSIQKRSMWYIFTDIRCFFWIFLISYISRAHLNGGETVYIADIFGFLDAFELIDWNLAISWNADGAGGALTFILTMITAMLTSDLLLSTTRISDFEDGVKRLFQWLHKGFAWKLALMLRLMLASFSIFLDTASLARKQMRIRGLLLRRHPIRYSQGIGGVMLKSADALTQGYTKAILLRGFSAEPLKTLRKL